MRGLSKSERQSLQDLEVVWEIVKRTHITKAYKAN